MTTQTIDFDQDADTDRQLSVVAPQGGILALPVEAMQQQLAEYAEKRNTFRDWLMSQMRQGIHYGTPPGCEPKTQEINGVTHYGVWMKGGYKFFPPEQWQPKQCLYKAGAQLLCDLLRLRTSFAICETPAAMVSTVVVKCHLFAGDRLIAEGHGARKVGAKGGDENNCIKMAEKCALVDAVLNYTGLSDLFTQDLEDADKAAPNVPPEANPNAPQAQPRGGRVTKDEIAPILERWKSLYGGPDATAADFGQWAFDTANVPVDGALKAFAWSREAMQKCIQRLDEDEAALTGGDL